MDFSVGFFLFSLVHLQSSFFLDIATESVSISVFFSILPFLVSFCLIFSYSSSSFALNSPLFGDPVLGCGFGWLTAPFVFPPHLYICDSWGRPWRTRAQTLRAPLWSSTRAHPCPASHCASHPGFTKSRTFLYEEGSVRTQLRMHV